MLNKEIFERIEKAKHHRLGTNCRSFLLYALGIIPEEIYIRSKDDLQEGLSHLVFEEFISLIELTKVPDKGYIIFVKDPMKIWKYLMLV